MICEESHIVMHVTMHVEGELVHTTTDESPLEYVQGCGGLGPGLEAALMGMRAGETKKTTVSPEDAFGEHDPQAIVAFPKAAFSEIESLEVGDSVRGTIEDRPFTALVHAVEGDEVTLDLNHPLAGKTVDFEVEVVEVR